MKIEIKMYFADNESLETALLEVVKSLKNSDMASVESYPFYIGSYRRIDDIVDVRDLDTGEFRD
jgi:hypothetical protein